jgi:hypothetical protein
MACSTGLPETAVGTRQEFFKILARLAERLKSRLGELFLISDRSARTSQGLPVNSLEITIASRGSNYSLGRLDQERRSKYRAVACQKVSFHKAFAF